MIDTTPQALFFDWDGTLVNTLPFLLRAHNHVRKEMGHKPWSVNEFKAYVLQSSGKIYTKIYGALAEKAFQILRVYMQENHLDNLEVFPDSLALLTYLKDCGIPVGIVSNKKHEFLVKEVSHLGWNHLTQSVIGAGFAAKDKPAADPLLLALKQCNLCPDEKIWYVGDSETDMITAQNASCSAVLIHHHHDNKHLIEDYRPRFAFDDCKSLQNALFSCSHILAKGA